MSIDDKVKSESDKPTEKYERRFCIGYGKTKPHEYFVKPDTPVPKPAYCRTCDERYLIDNIGHVQLPPPEEKK